MHAERARAGRLPEAVVLHHAGAAVAHQAGGDAAVALAQDLRGDQVVGAPAVADLTGAVGGIAALLPVDLVRGDAGGIVAVEERGEALAQRLDRSRSEKTFLDDQEAVALEALGLIVGDVVEAPTRIAVQHGTPRWTDSFNEATGDSIAPPGAPRRPALRGSRRGDARADPRARQRLPRGGRLRARGGAGPDRGNDRAPRARQGARACARSTSRRSRWPTASSGPPPPSSRRGACRRGDPGRAARIDAALSEASASPLAIAEAAAEVAELGAWCRRSRRQGPFAAMRCRRAARRGGLGRAAPWWR